MNAPKSDDRKAEPWSDLLGDFQLDVFIHHSFLNCIMNLISKSAGLHKANKYN